LGHVPTVVPIIFLLGAANGMSTLARANIVSDIFGRAHYASISGALAMGANGARALAPIGASLLYQGLGSYEALFGALAVSLGAISTLWSRRTPVSCSTIRRLDRSPSTDHTPTGERGAHPAPAS